MKKEDIFGHDTTNSIFMYLQKMILSVKTAEWNEAVIVSKHERLVNINEMDTDGITLF